MDLSPQQRAELLRLRAQCREQMTKLEGMIAHEEAVTLAPEERLGREPEDGTLITPEDDERAGKILADCWRPI